MDVNCPRCKGATFGVYSKIVNHSTTPVAFVYCEGCRGVVGVFDPKVTELAATLQVTKSAVDRLTARIS